MRLKQIKLAGFKSFVDPTVAPFPDNLTAIVGPNGCGKSNIIDAVRWVMGESSAKHLRGDSMSDVIFNGSSARKPVAQASVELVFDNSEGKLQGEYAKYNEIATKRLVTRDGQSVYSLNGTRCRRKDITDLFLGTGLGPRSYAIIEQGMISRLIESKPQELRVFIEEAAGISKYKERRRETENRIRHSKDNLDRLNDLREELGNQLAHLQRQATAAEKYKGLKSEERQAKAELAAIRWQSLDKTLTQGEQHLSELEVQLEAKIADQRNVDLKLEQAREQHIQLSDQFNAVQGRFYSIGSDIARLEQGIQHAKDRKLQLNNDLAEANLALRNAQDHQQSDGEKAASISEELLELEPELDLLNDVIDQSSEALHHSEEAMQDWQSQWDQFNECAADNKKQAEILQTRITHAETLSSRMLARIDKLKEENFALSDDQEDEGVQEAIAMLQEYESKATNYQNEVDALYLKLDQYRSDLKQEKRVFVERQSEWQKLQSQFVALKAVQDAALASSDDNQEHWLNANGMSDAERLAQNIRVDKQWSRALELVLDTELEAICIDDIAALTDGEFAETNIAFVAKGGNHADSPSNTLLSKITSDYDVSNKLADILLADDLASAFQMRQHLSAKQSVVTPCGYWLGRQWLRVKKQAGAATGVLDREQELQTVSEALDLAKNRFEEQEARVDSLTVALADAENESQAKQIALNDLNRQCANLQARVGAQQAKLEQIEKRKVRIDQEIAETQSQVQEEREQLAHNRLELEKIVDAMANDETQKNTLQTAREERRANLNSARQRAKEEKEQYHRLALRAESLKAEQTTIQNQQQRNTELVLQLNERIESLQEALEENEAPVTTMDEELALKLTTRIEVESELVKSREETEQIENQLRGLDKDRLLFEQGSQAIREKLERSRLECQGLRLQKESQAEQIQELDSDLAVLLEQLPADHTENAWIEKIDKLHSRIQRLGAINLAAIDEFKTQSERKVYLDAQNDDLLAALETLENAIRKIDKETKQRFKETYDQINDGLQELFPKVFGGGHAYLELTDDDLLETGVTIMARPPGKKNSTIHLLSGGEKALTALSLVFAIFRLNPAPFCLLDEVDAPLDDANVGRFCKLVKEMSAQVQFIYISHNKVTMEMASHMQGVTMHEPGVSRLVSVDIEEAAQLVNA